VRICCSPLPTDSAAIEAPVSYSVCAMSAPSLDRNSFSSLQISYDERVVRSVGCARCIAASASSSSWTRSSKRTVHGSISIGVVYVAVTGFTGASRASSRFVSADARATSTASAGDAVGLVSGEDRRRGEPPRAVGDRADREAEDIGAVDVLEMPVLHQDVLDGAPHETCVGVCRATGAGGVERAMSEVPFDGTEHQEVRTR